MTTKSIVVTGMAVALVGTATVVPAAAASAPVAPSVGASATTHVAAAPAVAQQSRAAALLEQGPSKWQGRKLRHPEGGSFDPQVLRWANLTVEVMDELNIPRKRLTGILAQMQQESSGNPNAVNRWDSNAKAGTPSKGLLQVIAPTYRAYAKKGYQNTKYQTVPYTNLYAALNYVKDAYGYGKFASWNQGSNAGY